jgi:signal transduction histidine kinase
MFSIFTIKETLSRERHRLKNIAQNIETVSDKLLTSSPEEIKHIKRDLYTSLRFIDKHNKIKYKVFNKKNGTIIVDLCQEQQKSQFPPMPQKTFLYHLNPHIKIRKKLVFRWDTTYLQTWNFKLYYYGKKLNILIEETRHLETLEMLLLFISFTFTLFILVSFISAQFITKRTLFHVNKISKMANELAQGNLSYQLTPSTNDEIGALEQNLNITALKLKNSFDKIHQFSSEVAHELRTPLTVIKGNLDVAIRQERSIEEYQKLLGTTISDITHLSRLIDDMLLLLKPIEKYDKSLFKTVNLSKTVLNATEQLSFLADLKGIKLELSITENIHVLGVETLLHRMIANLIHNSIKFSDMNKIIFISLVEDKYDVILTIKDQGIGIQKEKMVKVFQRFYKSEGSTGHGLGLPMVKQLVKVHSGTITLTQNSPQGSIFIINLPRNKK